MLAVEPEPPLSTPDEADDLHRLFQRTKCLARGSPHASIALNGIPERSGTETELETAAAQDIDCRGRLRQHRRRTQREGDHVGEERDSLRARCEMADAAAPSASGTTKRPNWRSRP